MLCAQSIEFPTNRLERVRKMSVQLVLAVAGSAAGASAGAGFAAFAGSLGMTAGGLGWAAGSAIGPTCDPDQVAAALKPASNEAEATHVDP